MAWIPAFAGMTLLILFFAGKGIAQDKVVLKEGKTLHGKIIDETDQEVTLRFRSSMILRVEKRKIRKIIRKGKKKKRKGQIVTLQQVQEKEKKEKEAKEKKEAAPEKEEKKEEAKKEPPKKDPPKPEKLTLKNVQPGVKTQVKKKGNVQIIETAENKVYAVEGKKFDDVIAAIFDRENGKGFKNRRRREASRTTMSLDNKSTSKKEAGLFRWENVVLVATVTVETPSWSAPKNLPDDEIKKWNDYLLKLQNHDGGHAEIYLRTLKSLSRSLAAFREKSEEDLQKKSDQTLKKSLQQAEKRQRGYDRRHSIKK